MIYKNYSVKYHNGKWEILSRRGNVLHKRVLADESFTRALVDLMAKEGASDEDLRSICLSLAQAMKDLKAEIRASKTGKMRGVKKVKTNKNG